METVYVIDVFNVMFKWKKTSALMRDGSFTAAERIFFDYLSSAGLKNNNFFMLFLDGADEMELSRKYGHNMRIIFCHPSDADTKIKKYIERQYNTSKKLIVISNDAEIISFARRFDYPTLSAERFIAKMDKQIHNSYSPASESDEKPETPNEKEIEEYIELMRVMGKYENNK